MKLPAVAMLDVWLELRSQWRSLERSEFVQRTQVFRREYCEGFSILPRKFAYEAFNLAVYNVKAGIIKPASNSRLTLYDPDPKHSLVFLRSSHGQELW